MVTNIINEFQKEIIADSGKFLSNGLIFDSYPTHLIVNINDNTWFEIVDTTQTPPSNEIDITQFQQNTGLSKDELLSLIYAGL